MTITLITGANKSLGYETARRLLDLGHQVYVAARDPERGRRAAGELGARFVQLDVTDAASIRAAAEQVGSESGRLDVLVNNAGISGPMVGAEDVTADLLRQVHEVNLFGPAQVLHEFLPLLRRSDHPVVVNVTSGLGSIAGVGTTAVEPSWRPTPVYSASKAALNMLTAQYAHLLPELRINVVDPGYTATDFNGHSGPKTVAEGADPIVRAATVAADGPTGQFLAARGTLPW